MEASIFSSGFLFRGTILRGSKLNEFCTAAQLSQMGFWKQHFFPGREAWERISFCRWKMKAFSRVGENRELVQPGEKVLVEEILTQPPRKEAFVRRGDRLGLCQSFCLKYLYPVDTIDSRKKQPRRYFCVIRGSQVLCPRQHFLLALLNSPLVNHNFRTRHRMLCTTLQLSTRLKLPCTMEITLYSAMWSQP